MQNFKINFYHIIPFFIASNNHASKDFLSNLWLTLIYSLILAVPFFVIYIWHIKHDHKHNRSLEEKLDKIIEIMKEKAGKK
jgi:hypothetical protein